MKYAGGTSLNGTTPQISSNRKKNRSGKGKLPVSEVKQEEANRCNDENAVGAVKSAGTPSTSSAVHGLSKNKKRQRARSSAAWTMSAPIGGWFIPQDPVFPSNEKHLFIANKREVQIYSTETSLLTGTLPVGSGILSSFALSTTKADRIYVASSEGIITLWDWARKSKIARWDIGTNIRYITVVTQPSSAQDLVYCHEFGKHPVINVHALRTKDQDSQTELKMILKAKSPIIGFQVLLEGKLVIVACNDSVLVGKRTKLQKTALQDFEYIWREFRTSKSVTAIDAYVRLPDPSRKGKGQSQDPRDNLDLAIGCQDGVICLFEDILSTFSRLEKNSKTGNQAGVDLEGLRPKQLHWHREAVRSIKWSRDGNYLISGGNETVIVIWQLSTGKQQHLPHLTAAIENIVVSPTGTSYSVSLANNSVVILSTTELNAKTNVIGVQSRRLDREQLPRDFTSSDYSFAIFGQVPMVVDPKTPSHVLFAVPSSQPRQQHLGIQEPEPYIQTFNIATQRPISRQAMTRNNATDPNIGPERTRILEPNLKHLKTSYDGKWLATVDEWIPPPGDMGYLEEGVSYFNEEERSFRREIYLKFWSWNAKNATWALESRIDAPHLFENVGASARILDLAFDPNGLRFATVGEDRYVRIWIPKTRTRNGVTVRGGDKDSTGGLVTWSLDRSIEFSSKLDVFDSNSSSPVSLAPRNARLGYSSDGSVLAVGVSWPSHSDSGVIHLIDVETGRIQRSITEIDMTALSCLGILGRHLVVVADSIIVWDLVVDELVYCVPFDAPGVDRLQRIPLIRLAINDNDATFAVAYPQFEKNDTSKSRSARNYKKASTRLLIFDPYQSLIRWSATLPEIVLSLVPSRDGKGYIALDSSSSIRLISPRASSLQLITPPELTGQNTPEQEPKIEQSDKREEANETNVSIDILAREELLQDSENDKPVVRPEQLQDIFDKGPSHALPPVRDLFSAVVDLYARKPKASTRLSVA
ncbi:WD40 repeat-like protein [Lojkania enalia]|uniref:WD40 repeat-like protein n=1 Tax=Lojkania enalia TaxID=147567 RepID=A0A9P4N7Q0_9PLEO|nr:WD40 repeat-like protein [Didymosphaeria enalia]